MESVQLWPAGRKCHAYHLSPVAMKQLRPEWLVGNDIVLLCQV
jgi:hypothetical protein